MNLQYNGHVYEHVPGGDEGDVIKERCRDLDGYVFTNLGGRPAILFNGELYVKREGGRDKGLLAWVKGRK
jgi:hypothetical protein